MPTTSNSTATPPSLDPVMVLARTLYGEARGEDRRGREMVANVIMNRVNIDLHGDGKPDWWGEGVVAVCLAPWQFSCWLPKDPNRTKLMAITEANPIFRECVEIARLAVANALPDRTHGATHYLNIPLVKKTTGTLPAWAADASKRTAAHGGHTFFRVI